MSYNKKQDSIIIDSISCFVYDLILQCAACAISTYNCKPPFNWSPRPDQTTIEKNKRLLQATFLGGETSDVDDDEALEGLPLPRKRKIEAAQFLLATLNGDWSKDQLIHHCRLGCCKSSKESKLKIWTALQASSWEKSVAIDTEFNLHIFLTNNC